MSDTKYVYQAVADLPDVTFDVMRQMVLLRAKTANLDVLENTDQALTVETQHGLIGLRAGQDAPVAAFVAAQNEHWLFIMKSAVVAQLGQVMPAVADAMRWSNGPAEGTLPPNFMFVRVRAVAPLGPDFLRVTFEGEDLSRHGDDAIHFRLVQPPKNSPPEWPSVAANGSIIWPDGAGATHKPVYTARSVDYDANTMECDVFLHDGGRTTDWAQEILGGHNPRRIVGLVGPIGGGILEGEKVLMASDETGFPAAARLLENLPQQATGQIFLEAEHGAACDYPFTVPTGIDVVWLSREKGETLVDAVLAVLPRHFGSKTWFAGEREQARQLREIAKEAGHEATDLRISGFWSASG